MVDTYHYIFGQMQLVTARVQMCKGMNTKQRGFSDNHLTLRIFPSSLLQNSLSFQKKYLIETSHLDSL